MQAQPQTDAEADRIAKHSRQVLGSLRKSKTRLIAAIAAGDVGRIARNCADINRRAKFLLANVPLQ